MGLFHFGLPSFLLEWAATEGLEVGVETGTLDGDSAHLIAAALGSCTTIELAEPLYERAQRRFGHDTRVTVLHGSSAELLPGVCAGLTGPALFWLDGHYSGGAAAGEHAQCPVLEELDALAALPDPTQHVVLIDDARLFGFVPSPAPHRHDWPGLSTVLNRLEAMGLRTYVVDDVVVGVGPQRVESFEQLLHHDGVRQHVPLFQHWRAVRFLVRWSPVGVRWRLARGRRRVRRVTWKVARRVLPRRLRRRMLHQWRRWR